LKDKEEIGDQDGELADLHHREGIGGEEVWSVIFIKLNSGRGRRGRTRMRKGGSRK